MNIVRTDHNIDIWGTFANCIAILLCQTSSNENLATISLGLPIFKLAECAVKLVIGVFANAACVNNNNVSLRNTADICHAILFEQARDAFGIVFIHLAPKGANKVIAGHDLSILSCWFTRLVYSVGLLGWFTVLEICQCP